MADIAWPASMRPESMVWTIQKAGVSFRSPYAGSIEAVTFPGWFWTISATIPNRLSTDGAEVEAFWEGMAGAEDAVLVYHWLRPVPRGTMRGTPVVNATAVRGDQVLKITTAQTLLAGDLFKVGNTVFKARYDCVAVAGVLTVPLVGRVRTTLAAGTAVVWDRPTVRCLVPSFNHSSVYQGGGVMAAIPIDLEEAP